MWKSSFLQVFSQQCWMFLNCDCERETLDVKKAIQAGRGFPRCCYLWSRGWAALSWRCTAERWWGQGRERTAAGGTSSPGRRWSWGSSLRGEEQRRDVSVRNFFFVCPAVKLAQQTRGGWMENVAGRFQQDAVSIRQSRDFRWGQMKKENTDCALSKWNTSVSLSRVSSPCYSERSSRIRIFEKSKQSARKAVQLKCLM